MNGVAAAWGVDDATFVSVTGHEVAAGVHEPATVLLDAVPA